MPVAASEGLGAPLELDGLNDVSGLARDAGACGAQGRTASTRGPRRPGQHRRRRAPALSCPKREAEGAPNLGGGALERECSTAQLRCEIDVVEALEPEAHA